MLYTKYPPDKFINVPAPVRYDDLGVKKSVTKWFIFLNFHQTHGKIVSNTDNIGLITKKTIKNQAVSLTQDDGWYPSYRLIQDFLEKKKQGLARAGLFMPATDRR